MSFIFLYHATKIVPGFPRSRDIVFNTFWQHHKGYFHLLISHNLCAFFPMTSLSFYLTDAQSILINTCVLKNYPCIFVFSYKLAIITQILCFICILTCPRLIFQWEEICWPSTLHESYDIGYNVLIPACKILIKMKQ